MGNLRSVEKAIEHVGATPGDQRRSAPRLAGRRAGPARRRGVSEGDGADRRARARRDDRRTRRRRTPVLGVCLGMQLLFESSTEHGGAAGLGLLEGEVEPLRGAGPEAAAHRLGEARDRAPDAADGGIADGEPFYFVHSLAPARDRAELLASADYGERFAALVGRGERLRRPVPSGEVERCRPADARQLRRRSASRRPLPARWEAPCEAASAMPEALDALPGDRHPRRPRRSAAAGRLRPRDRLRRRPARRRPALGRRAAPRSSTSSTSTAPGRAPRRTSTIVERIAAAAGVPVQVGGGLRDAEAVDAVLAAGAARAVLGTRAQRDPAFVGELVAAPRKRADRRLRRRPRRPRRRRGLGAGDRDAGRRAGRRARRARRRGASSTRRSRSTAPSKGPASSGLGRDRRPAWATGGRADLLRRRGQPRRPARARALTPGTRVRRRDRRPSPVRAALRRSREARAALAGDDSTQEGRDERALTMAAKTGMKWTIWAPGPDPRRGRAGDQAPPRSARRATRRASCSELVAQVEGQAVEPEQARARAAQADRRQARAERASPRRPRSPRCPWRKPR